MKIGLLILALLLGGCSSAPKPALSPFSLNIKADKTVNPSASNQANPVIVRLYQLTDIQTFEQAPFIDLYEKDSQILGSSLISKQVLPVIVPNSEISKVVKINKSTQYVAVLVEFVNFKDSETKSFSIVPTEEDQFLRLLVTQSKVSLETVTPESNWWNIF
jgi:type VI secretion system protein VasD